MNSNINKGDALKEQDKMSDSTQALETAPNKEPTGGISILPIHDEQMQPEVTLNCGDAESGSTNSNTLTLCALGPICLAIIIGSFIIENLVLLIIMILPVLIFIPLGALVGIVYFTDRDRPPSKLRTFYIGVCTFINVGILLFVLSTWIFQ
jgi:hypothetical protein